MTDTSIVNSKDINDIPKLKGRENYMDWKIDMKNLLISEKYWACIGSYPAGDTTSDEEKAAKDGKALALMIRMVEPDVKPYIRVAKSAIEAWTTLKRAYEGEGANLRINLIQSLCSVKLQDFNNVQEYVNEFMLIAWKVSTTGKPIDEEMLGVLMLKGLTNRYKPMIMAIENSNINLTSDYVKRKLLPHLEFNGNGNSNSNRNVSRLPIEKPKKKRPKKKKKPRCFQCGELGHVIQSCSKPENESSVNSTLKTEKKNEREVPIADATNTGRSSVELKTETGHQLYEAKKYKDALAVYTEVIEIYESPVCYAHRAACFLMLSEYHKALDDADRCIALDPTCIKAYATMMKCSLIVGDVIGAKSALRKVLELDANNSGIIADQTHLEYLEKCLKAAKVAYVKKDYSKAIHCWECCCEVSTSCPAFEQRKTECLALLAKQKQEARDKAILLELKTKTADQLFKTKRYNEALAVYTEAIKLSPVSSAYYDNRAACYMMLSKYREALADSKICITIDPDCIKAYTRVIKCSLIMGEIGGAKSALSEVLTLDPNNRSILADQKNLEYLEKFLKESEVALAKEEFCKVIYCMDRCCEVSTLCPAYKLQKAECLIILRSFGAAQEIVNDILLIDKQNVDAIYVHAMSLYYRDDKDKACARFREVFRLVPDHTKALHMYKKLKTLMETHEKGNAAFKMQKYDEALDFYTEALTTDPRNILVNAILHCNRALAYAKLEKFRESLQDCTQALKLNKDFLKALVQRAKCHTELRDFEEAVYDYEQICRMNESSEYKKLLQEAKFAFEKCERKDYYFILGIDKKASIDDIKKAYRKRAIVHHPDKHSDASDGEKRKQERKFKQVGEAYAILSDPQKRYRYDRGHDLDDD